MSGINVMLDLETLSSASDAAIVAIGAVRFTKEGICQEDGAKFYRTISAQSAQKAGGRIDGSTVLWWLQQSDAARKELTGDGNVLIEVALKEFANWLRETAVEGVWGNGSDFDNVILGNAYALAMNWKQPWSHRSNRCYRTLKSLVTAEEVPFVRSGVAHNALDDAITQADHLVKIVKHLKLDI
jgi:exodeoxyribonuclease VIII